MPSINAIIPGLGCTSPSFDPFVALYLLYGLSLVEELPLYQLLDVEGFQSPIQLEVEVLQPQLQLVENAQLVGHGMQ